MEHEPHIAFGPFRLEATPGRLWRGADIIALRPRSLAVLRYLAMHPGRLVTKAELRRQVWEGTHVTDIVVRGCIWDIRAALGDSATTPQYLETIGRQGYRFLVLGDGTVPPLIASSPIVGRQGEVHALEECFQHAASGTRQLVFVSGEAGIGKTTVVDLFLARLAAGRAVRIGKGQCVEFYGEGEPYQPVLEALGRLGRGLQGQEIVAVLQRYAPMWLMQLPGLVSDAELERLQRQVQGATQGRMMRELAEALDVLATDMPLVLVLEDLHWSDRATVECLNALAQRREPARLLVLGTVRRGQLHRRLGLRLEVGYGTRAAEIVTQLAVHFERGGEMQRAVHYWQQAGEHATRRNAPHEAITALTRGLALLAALPDSPERARHELTLQLTLGDLLLAAKGMVAPEVGEAYTRAHTLCQQVGETQQRCRALWGLAFFHGAQARLRTASELSQQLFHLAQRQPDPCFMLEGQVAMGAMALFRGDFSTARAHLEYSLRFSDPLRPSPPTVQGGFVPG